MKALIDDLLAYARVESRGKNLELIESESYGFQLRVIHKRSPFDRLRVNGKKLSWIGTPVRAELVEA